MMSLTDKIRENEKKVMAEYLREYAEDKRPVYAYHKWMRFSMLGMLAFALVFTGWFFVKSEKASFFLLIAVIAVSTVVFTLILRIKSRYKIQSDDELIIAMKNKASRISQPLILAATAFTAGGYLTVTDSTVTLGGTNVVMIFAALYAYNYVLEKLIFLLLDRTPKDEEDE